MEIQVIQAYRFQEIKIGKPAEPYLEEVLRIIIFNYISIIYY